MSLKRRFALLQAAETADAWIIEDDYDGEFHYGGHPLPSLKNVDQTGRVFYVGTFSKTLFPALRLGYFLAPPAMVDTFHAAIDAYFPGVPSNPQAVVADFMEEGHYATHIRRMRWVYMERHAIFLECATRYLAELLDVEATDTGLHTIGHLRANLSDIEVTEKAEEQNITVAPIRQFCIAPIDVNGLVLGFSGINPSEIERGMKTLASVLESLASRSNPTITVSIQ